MSLFLTECHILIEMCSTQQCLNYTLRYKIGLDCVEIIWVMFDVFDI